MSLEAQDAPMPGAKGGNTGAQAASPVTARARPPEGGGAERPSERKRRGCHGAKKAAGAPELTTEAKGSRARTAGRLTPQPRDPAPEKGEEGGEGGRAARGAPLIIARQGYGSAQKRQGAEAP